MIFRMIRKSRTLIAKVLLTRVAVAVIDRRAAEIAEEIVAVAEDVRAAVDVDEDVAAVAEVAVDGMAVGMVDTVAMAAVVTDGGIQRA